MRYFRFLFQNEAFVLMSNRMSDFGDVFIVTGSDSCTLQKRLAIWEERLDFFKRKMSFYRCNGMALRNKYMTIILGNKKCHYVKSITVSYASFGAVKVFMIIGLLPKSGFRATKNIGTTEARSIITFAALWLVSIIIWERLWVITNICLIQAASLSLLIINAFWALRKVIIFCIPPNCECVSEKCGRCRRQAVALILLLQISRL